MWEINFNFCFSEGFVLGKIEIFGNLRQFWQFHLTFYSSRSFLSALSLTTCLCVLAFCTHSERQTLSLSAMLQQCRFFCCMLLGAHSLPLACKALHRKTSVHMWAVEFCFYLNTHTHSFLYTYKRNVKIKIIIKSQKAY